MLSLLPDPARRITTSRLWRQIQSKLMRRLENAVCSESAMGVFAATSADIVN
jgi:hypothetical protein